MADRTRFGMVTAMASLSLVGCSPAIVQPTSRATISAATSPTSAPTAAAATAPYPVSAAFWDTQHGLLIVTAACPGGDNTCSGGVIERTDDAGKSWHVVDRVSASLSAVAVAGSQAAWVSVAGSGCGAGPGSCAASTFLVTTDGGTKWAEVSSRTPVTSVSPASATTVWALAGPPGIAAGATLVHSADAGRTWQQRGNPCSRMGGVGPSSVDFAGLVRGWLVCTGAPATDMQPKALLSTGNGGVTWQLQADTCGPFARIVGTLSCVGDGPTTSLLPDGHGWMWMSRGSLTATSNGGQTWSQIAADVVAIDLNEVMSASLVTDLDGFLLITRPESETGCTAINCGPQLLSTHDGGRTWTIVSTWSP
jgi:photosystem II stability/assembly factor-like uncharacterized protein